MTTTSGPDGPTREPRPAGQQTGKQPNYTLRRIMVGLAGLVALLLVVSVVGGYLVFRHLNDNITVTPVPSGILKTTPSAAQPPLDILVMGSDTRAGQNGEGGSVAQTPTAASDVVMLVHISADRQRALVMSVPRDTRVEVPGCGHYKDQMGKFNLAYTFGGAPCTVQLFKQLTGISVDHFIVIDFNGVKDVINALGGVSFCLAKPYKDLEYTGLNLPAGEQVINGDQGLAFLRVRHNIGDATGDLGRLTRQHAFLSAMIRQIEGQSVLTNLPTLYKVLDATTANLTTDPGLGSLLKLKSLAESLRNLKPANITFVTMPNKDAGNNSDVLLDAAAAKPLFDAIKNDTPWPVVAKPSATPSPSATASALVTAPSKIHVKVLNGTSTNGLAKKVADQLAAEGFVIDGYATAPAKTATSSVAYPAAYDESARTLAAAAGGVPTATSAGLSTTLVLTVGADFGTVHAVSVAGSPSATPSAGSSGTTSSEDVQTANQTGCV